MNVIYKVNMKEYEADSQFPKLKRTFKRDIVESGMDNPHKELVKWLVNNDEPTITYAIGVVK